MWGGIAGGAGGSEWDCVVAADMTDETAEEELTAGEGTRLDWGVWEPSGDSALPRRNAPEEEAGG